MHDPKACMDDRDCPSGYQWLVDYIINFNNLFWFHFSKEPKSVTSLNYFIQTLTSQKSRTVSNWLLIGLHLHERM